MSTLITTSAIQCVWNDDQIEVFNASSKSEARVHALIFAECPSGITLDKGRLETWVYDDPRPTDWKDSYVFNTIDEYDELEDQDGTIITLKY